MSGKFMRIEKIIIPTLTAIMIASQLTGCEAASQSELLNMLQNGEQIEIEVALPAYAETEQGTETPIQWIELASISNNETLRSGWDDEMGIVMTDIGKNGLLYVNAEGANENNNTLAVVMHNREFQKLLESEDSQKTLSTYVAEQYVDVDEDENESTESTEPTEPTERSEILKQVYIGINGYFNLLPDNEVNYANPNSPITRAEAMALLFRADTPVTPTPISPDTTLTDAVGDNPLNPYAQGVVSDNYLDLTSKSLNNLTYNGSITRAEFIYLLMHRYFQDELSTASTSTTTSPTTPFTDAKDGGNIASEQQFDTTLPYWKSYELTYALQNPDDGLPTELYNALVVANQLGLIGSETRWDESITLSEAVELLCKALQLDDSIPTFSYKLGEMTGYTAPTDPTATTETQSGGADSDNQTTSDNPYAAYEDEEIEERLTPEQYQDYLERMERFDDPSIRAMCTPEEYEEYLESMKEVAENRAIDPHYYDDIYEETDSNSNYNPNSTTGLEEPVSTGPEFDPSSVDASNLKPCEVN